MPTHQYQLMDGDGELRLCNANASSVSLAMNADGTVSAKDSYGEKFRVEELVIYYIDNADDFTLTVTGRNPTVASVSVTILSGTGKGPSYSHVINGDGHLVMTFGGASTNGSEALWEFSHSAPSLHVKVRVKRQAQAISCP